MQYDFRQIAEKLKQRNKKKHRWSKVVSALACAVAFCTTYALILPALTIESKENLFPPGENGAIASDSNAEKDTESDRLSEILDRLGGYHKEKSEKTKVEADVIYVNSSSNAEKILVSSGSNAQMKSASNAKLAESRTMIHKGKDYSVTVSFTGEAGLPDDVELKVRELKQGSREYEEHYRQTEEILPEDQGMLLCRFFDVSFVADGEEIEPEASVDVQISYDEPILKEEGVNCTTVHFAEDGVEVLANEVTQTENGEDIVAFTQDSFSVVGTAITTLNLSNGSYIFYKDGYALGTNGYYVMPIEITIDEKGYVYPKNTNIPISRITWSYSSSGLRNQAAARYLSLANSVVSLSSSSYALNARIIGNAVRFSQYDNATYNYYLGFDTKQQTYKSGQLFADGEYFLAAKLANVDDVLIQEGDLSVEDLIKTDGILQAKVNNTALEGKTLEYVWYRSDDNGTTWKKVERRRITGDSYNTAEDGSWVNVALDKGADKDYKVEVLSIDGVQAAAGTASSNAYHVPYYDSVQNGDFEEPEISTNTSNTEHYQPLLPNDTAGMVWRTTASDEVVEFVSVASDAFKKMSYQWHNCDSAASGNQYVELNATMAGALYQDILTVPGSKMFWKLAHRGRGLDSRKSDPNMTDTMYVVIMSTKLAEDNDITTQEKVIDVINHTSNYPGADVVKITDDNIKWYYHDGTYQVPSGQYLTRYFFVAGETAFDKYSPGSSLLGTVGNHLDDIHFSTQLPPPDEGKVNLQITKTIVGLDKTSAEELLKKMSFKINNNEVIAGTRFGELIGNDDGSFTAMYQASYDIGTAGSITNVISENTSSAEVSGYNRKTTVSTSGVSSPVTNQELSSVTVRINNKGTGVVSFVNTYEKQTTPITLLKVDEKDQPLQGAGFKLEFYDESSLAWKNAQTDIESGADGTAVVPDLKYGVRYRLTETTAPDGYYPLTKPVYFKVMVENTTSAIKLLDQNENTSTEWGEQITALDTGLGLKIKNYHGMLLPETGGTGTGKIYLFGGVLLLTTWFFYRCRKKKLCEGRSEQ